MVRDSTINTLKPIFYLGSAYFAYRFIDSYITPDWQRPESIPPEAVEKYKRLVSLVVCINFGYEIDVMSMTGGEL